MIPDPPNWFFSACSFMGFILCMIPLPWHLEGDFIVPKHRIVSNVPSSMEHGYLHVHDMDGIDMLDLLH